jgi:hypothetical protein
MLRSDRARAPGSLALPSFPSDLAGHLAGRTRIPMPGVRRWTGRDAGSGVLQEPSSVAVGRQRSPSVPAGMFSGRLRTARRPSMLNHLRTQVFRTADVAVLLALTAVLGSAAHAFQAPAAGDLGYDIYDIVVNQGVKGPLGFVGGVAAFLFGVSRLFSNIMIGIPTIVAAVCLIKADSILQTFGMVI